MNREELERLTKPELIDLLLRLQRKRVLRAALFLMWWLRCCAPFVLG